MQDKHAGCGLESVKFSKQGCREPGLSLLCLPLALASLSLPLSLSFSASLSLSLRLPPLSPFPMPLPRKNANHFPLNLLRTTQGYIYLNPGSNAHVKIKISEFSFLQTMERGH